MTEDAGPAITLGIEEEFFLVDPETRDLLSDPDPAIFEACEATRGPHKVVREALRTQIETNTRVCASLAELREALVETRRIVIRAAERHGARIMASSTHPFASWADQDITPKKRYESFLSTMRFQGLVRRLLIGGMHIHAGFGSPDERIRVMTALRRHLPVLHALSSSSPFSDGHDTGLQVVAPRHLQRAARARACRGPSRRGRTTSGSWPSTGAGTSSATAASCGGTSAPHRPTRRSRCASATSARGSRTP